MSFLRTSNWNDPKNMSRLSYFAGIYGLFAYKGGGRIMFPAVLLGVSFSMCSSSIRMGRELKWDDLMYKGGSLLTALTAACFLGASVSVTLSCRDPVAFVCACASTASLARYGVKGIFDLQVQSGHLPMVTEDEGDEDD